MCKRYRKKSNGFELLAPKAINFSRKSENLFWGALLGCILFHIKKTL